MKGILNSKVFVLCCGVLSLATSEIARADGATGVSVRVRMIHAKDLIDNTKSDRQSARIAEASSDRPALKGAVSLPGLDDISQKLRKLQYRQFNLIASQREVVPMMKKTTLFLSDGNELTVRPLYTDGKKVGMWLKWVDAAGTKVLDTRMHFMCGETMVAGSERESGDATVLAIDVHPLDE